MPVGVLRAAIALLWPEDMTPYAKSILDALCERFDGAVVGSFGGAQWAEGYGPEAHNDGEASRENGS